MPSSGLLRLYGIFCGFLCMGNDRDNSENADKKGKRVTKEEDKIKIKKQNRNERGSYIIHLMVKKKRKKKEQLGFLRSPDCVCVYTVCIYTNTLCSRILNHLEHYKYIVHFFFFFQKITF